MAFQYVMDDFFYLSKFGFGAVVMAVCCFVIFERNNDVIMINSTFYIVIAAELGLLVAMCLIFGACGGVTFT